MNNLRIVFMGTPHFSVGILQAIKNAGMNLAGIVTVADKPAGRGQLMHESPVKQFAIENHIPVLQPLKLKDPEFLSQLESLQADVFVVVAFRMLPAEVWKMPKYGTFNLHASLLPDYRGAAPINWAIINGDQKTGVSTFFIDEAIDTGNVIGRTEMNISENESAGELHDRMIDVGGRLVVETLQRIANNDVNPIPQAELGSGSMRPAPKLFKENTQINWNAKPEDIHNLVRGLNPYPAAWTSWRNSKGEMKNVKVFKTLISDQSGSGTLQLSSSKTQLFVDTQEKRLEIVEFQVEGKKKMTAKEWLVGNNSSDWTINFN
ncbi:MAG: methionyl-tRNA formyltransferase [Fluviicola sp.]|jgi:methionyl-tRNA formyltransferase|uniref:methionyl-tRNA formyltransferase n=1 Tax=Fluviicola sp. TaxID=1917219 RepID=UPI002620DC15|nr:methionyl-tRNA formyltransferase [Fluviicola sp.]MDF3026190.1 methionyl-tRNA formyltransferase [Fluviicola sp.]